MTATIPARQVDTRTRVPHARGVVAARTMRAAARSAAAWGTAFAAYVAVQTLAYTSAYPTAASRAELERAYGTNVGLNALIGPAHAIDTVRGYAEWRLLGILSVLGAVWGLLLATRLTRGEEDAGRAELLLTGATTRRSAARQQVAGLGFGALVLFLLTAAGTVLTGLAGSVAIPAGVALFFAVTLAAGAAMFLAVGLLCAQLLATRRRAAALAGGIFGAAYALRMAADANPSVHWLVWLSPLGWVEETRPLSGGRALPLVPVLVLIAVLAVVSVRLAGRRDVGAGLLAAGDSAAPRMRLLRSPWTLTVRLVRGSAVGWLAGLAAYALLIGSVAEGATHDEVGAGGVQQALARLGGRGPLVEAYLGLMLIVLAAMLGLIAGAQLTALRAEESSGRLETLLVRPVSRLRWLAGRLGTAAVLVLVGGVMGGALAWVGARSQHARLGLRPLLEAGVNITPPALFLLGLGTAVFGLLPRRTAAVAYGYLAWAALVEFLGGVLKINHWVLDTSVFFHMAPAPATAPRWGADAAVVTLGLAAALAGAAAFARRDLLPHD